MYSPGVNTNGLPAQPSFPQYNQKSAFSPPYSKNVAGGPDQGNMMPPQQMSSHSGPYGGMPQQQQQPQRRLDPDQMPNPVIFGQFSIHLYYPECGIFNESLFSTDSSNERGPRIA